MKHLLSTLLFCLLSLFLAVYYVHDAFADEGMKAEDLDRKLEAEVQRDVVALHEFFVGWYNGVLPRSAFETEFITALDPAFTIIMPTGLELDYETLTAAMRDSFGKNVDFRIEIRNVRLIQFSETSIVANYEEWQHNTQLKTGSGSGRVSTVVFERGEVLKWLHVHETWLPEEVVRSDPFKF